MSKSQNIDNSLQAQGNSINFIAFSGGGAKGAGYAGVYNALKNTHILDGVLAVSGSSAGAITAAFVASNVAVEEFASISQNTNLKGLLGKGILPFNKDGAPLYELVQKTIASSVKNFLETNDIYLLISKRTSELLEKAEEFQEHLLVLKDLQKTTKLKLNDFNSDASLADNNQTFRLSQMELLQTQLQKLEEEIKSTNYHLSENHKTTNQLVELYDKKPNDLESLNSRIKNDDKIYFKDLSLLRLLDPVQFKDLYITAVRKDNGELTIFNAENTPDVEIAKAVRASASIPIIFKPAEIDGVKYGDGGYRDNIPVSYFPKKESNNEVEKVTDNVEEITGNSEKIADAKNNGRVLAFAFGSEDMNDAANIAIYSSKEKIIDYSSFEKFILDIVVKIVAKFGGHFKYSEEEEKTYQNIRDNALGVVVLDTKDVSTLSFDEAQKNAEYLQVKGYCQTMEHISNHDLGQVPKAFKYQNFLLNVYENIPNYDAKSWTDKLENNHNLKANLLVFSKPEMWKKNDLSNTLGDAVALLASNQDKTKFSNKTKGIKALIEKLNNPTCPNNIKQDFIKILGVSEEKATNANYLKNFKFSEQDFKPFVDNKAKELNKITGRNY